VSEASYETGYRDGEHNRETDVRIAIEHSGSWDELLERLRGIIGDPDAELGSEFGLNDNAG
jgi:hypothetical protein